MDVQAARDDPIQPLSANLPTSTLMITPEIDSEIEQWRKSGIPPFPELLLNARKDWYRFSKPTLRLIYHIAGLSVDLHRRGLAAAVFWTAHMSRSVVYGDHRGPS